VHPETDAQVEAIDKILHLRKGSRILDVACGSGRHTIGLAKRGYRMTGFDLSRALLAEARKSARLAQVKPTFVEGDMRRLRFTNAFDAAISMFTSFGYFDGPEEDREVLRGIARALHRVLGGLDLSPYTARSRRMVLYAVKGLEPEGIRTVW